jgi:hypothetical protein
MMTTHATTLALSGIFFSSLAATACDAVQGNGRATTEQRDTSAFTQVENRSSLSVSVVRGDTFSVDVRIDSNLQPLVETTVAAGVLRIDETEPFDAQASSFVSIVMPSLDAAGNDGSGDMTIRGFTQASLALSSGGSGGVAFDGTAGTLSVDASGSGSVDVAGSATYLSARAAGSGGIDASGLTTDGADLTTTGSGGVVATVHGDASLIAEGSGSIDATLSGGTASFSVTGSGSITWTGDERVASVTQTGSGRVEHR